MGDKLRDLTIRLARVYVPAHLRATDDGVVHVKGYSYNRSGGSNTLKDSSSSPYDDSFRSAIGTRWDKQTPVTPQEAKRILDQLKVKALADKESGWTYTDAISTRPDRATTTADVLLAVKTKGNLFDISGEPEDQGEVTPGGWQLFHANGSTHYTDEERSADHPDWEKRLAKVKSGDTSEFQLVDLSEGVAKLARVYIPPHVRVRDGNRQDVDGYWREVKGGNAIANALQEQKVKATGKPDAKKKLKDIQTGKKKPTKIGDKPATFGEVADALEKKGTAKASPKKDAKTEKTPEANALAEKIRNIDEVPDDGDGESIENPVVTDDIEEAVRLLSQDKHVRLKTKRQASTLLDRLAELVDEAKAKGEEAPNIDLCKVTVKDSNLFCIDSVTDPDTGKKIPRIKMPQFSGIPEPGSEADKFPKNEKGEVNLSEAFAKYLVSRGIGVNDEQIGASFLKASQNELGGPQVAKIAKSMEEKGIDRDQAWVWTSNDDYVIDGHHRWAGMVGVSLKTGEDPMVPIHKVDLDIISVLKLAREWTKEMGLKSKSVEDAQSGKAALSAADRLRELVSLSRDCDC